MPYGLWDVQGKLIIPGTRKAANFGPVRIGDVNRQTASKHLAKMLNKKFAKDLRGDNKFSDHFALMNLRWEEVGKASAALTGKKAPEPPKEAAAE